MMMEIPLGWFIAMVILSSVGGFVLFVLFLVLAGLLFFRIADWLEYKIEKRRSMPHDSRDN